MVPLLGFSGKDFRKELLEFDPFLKCVRESIEANGTEALEYPYDYMDFDDLYGTKEWKNLFNTFEYLQTIYNDVDRAETTSSACAEAIETLKRAGFKITRA